jgi:hypothetical protein
MLPKNKSISNPFYYYRGDPINEYNRIYKHLGSRINSKYEQIVYLRTVRNKPTPQVFGEFNNFIVQDTENIYSETIFQAPDGHQGPLGNNLVALEFFNILIGKKKYELPYIDIKSNTKNTVNTQLSTSSNTAWLPLEFDNVTIDLDEVIVGVLLEDKVSVEERVNYKSFTNDYFAKNHIKSFFSIVNDRKDPVHFPVLPLDFKLDQDTEIIIKYRALGKEEEIRLGTVNMLTDIYGYFLIPEVFIDYDIKEERYYRRGLMTIQLIEKYAKLEKAKDISLWLGEKKIYNLKKSQTENGIGIKGLALYPEKFDYFIFRSRLSYPKHIDDYADLGIAYMSFRKDGQKIKSISIGSWSKKKLDKKINTDRFIKKIDFRPTEKDKLEI